MISPILPAHDADTITLDFGVFVAEHARTYRTSQSAIIAALRPCITSPQPETTPSHAPAAQTDGEGSPPYASSSVESFTEAPKPLPDAPDNSADALVQPAEAKTSDQEDGGAVSAVKGANARMENAEGVEPPPSEPSPRMSKREQVRACHIEHPDWTSHQIAEHLGYGVQHIQVMASHLSLKLPRAPRTAPENMRDKVLAVVAAHPDWTLRQIAAEAGCSLGTASKWAKESVAKPPEAEAPSDEPQTQPAPELPPLSKPSDRLSSLPSPVKKAAKPVKVAPPKPLAVVTVPNEPRRPIPTHAPRGAGKSVRFYVRDAKGRYVHQSLDPSPTDTGPLMTLKRIYAWFPTDSQFRAAMVRWPELATMRQEGAQP